MPVVSTQELWEGEGGTGDFNRRRTYTRIVEVLTNATTDRANTVTAAVPIAIGDSHPDDLAAVCVSIKPSRSAESPLRWLVAYEYDTQPPFPQSQDAGGSTTSPGEIPENPLARPPVWKIGFQQTTEAISTAYAYNRTTGEYTSGSEPIRNSANLPYDPPVTVEVSRPVITVQINQAGINLAAIAELADSVNTRTWNGLNPRVARALPPEAQSAFENGVSFWQVTYQFALKFDTWDRRVLDAGYSLYDSGLNKWKEIVDDLGRKPTGPVPLDGAGQVLTPGESEVYNVFRVYKGRDFNTLLPF